MTGTEAPGPQIAISGTEFRDVHVSELLRTAELVDADGIELWYPENFTVAGTAAVERSVAAWSGHVVAVSAGVEVAEIDNAARSVPLLLEAVEIARRLNSPRVNTYFGAPGFRDDRISGDNFLRNAAPVLDRAQQLGVTIVLENEFNAFGRDHVRGDLTRRPSALRDLLLRAGSASLRLNFDAANFYCAGAEPYPYAYGILRELIDYIHVKDVRMTSPAQATGDGVVWHEYRDYTRAYVTTWLGSGAVNWAGLLGQLCADGYQGPLTLEPHARAAHRTAAFAQGADWLRHHLRHGYPAAGWRTSPLPGAR